MTTTIRDAVDSRGHVSIGARHDEPSNTRIEVYMGRGAWTPGVVVVDRDKFLAAVAAELDVVIIPRADLPEFSQDECGSLVDGTRLGRVRLSAAALRADAYRYLAMAEYFEKNPPVDEAQVDALVELISGLDLNLGGSTRTYARRLVQAGVRAPKEDQ